MIERFIQGFLLVCILASTKSSVANCGTGLSLPKFFFDGVNDDGTVYHAEKWFDLIASNGTKVPFILSFDSTRIPVSPYVGHGWRVSLFESHAFLKDERTVRVIMPDGYAFTFLEKGGAGLYEGNQGWKGKLDGDRFAVSKPCGGVGLEFKAGHLEVLQIGDESFLLQRNSENKVEFIQRKSDQEKVVECSYSKNGLEWSISSGRRTFVVRNSLVADEALREPGLLSLASVDCSSTLGEKDEFSRSYDLRYSKGEGELKIGGWRGLVSNYIWSRDVGRILESGQWKYSVTEHEGQISIERICPDGTEFYSNDKDRGIRIERRLGQKLFSKFEYFPRGGLRNFTRKVSVSEQLVGPWDVRIQTNFDSNGEVLREIDKDRGIEVRNYKDTRGLAIEETRELSTNKIVKVTKTSARGCEFAELYDKQIKIVYEYDESNKFVGRSIVPLQVK